jgi:capsular exopolysaccharide synthesis family protein
VPGEGKTTLAVNLAVALAEAGKHATLVDADLRRPRVTRHLGLVAGVGVTTVLTGAAALEEVIQPVGDGGLQVLAAGPRPPNPSELLSSEAMSELLEQLARTRDIVVIDAPPLLPVADTSALAGLVDGVLVCARWGSVDAEELQRSAAILDRLGAKLLGVVMTQVRGRSAVAYGYGGEPEPAAHRRGLFARRSPSALPVVVPAVLPRATKTTSTRRRVPGTRALVETSDG